MPPSKFPPRSSPLPQRPSRPQRPQQECFDGLIPVTTLPASQTYPYPEVVPPEERGLKKEKSYPEVVDIVFPTGTLLSPGTGVQSPDVVSPVSPVTRGTIGNWVWRSTGNNCRELSRAGTTIATGYGHRTGETLPRPAAFELPFPPPVLSHHQVGYSRGDRVLSRDSEGIRSLQRAWSEVGSPETSPKSIPGKGEKGTPDQLGSPGRWKWKLGIGRKERRRKRQIWRSLMLWALAIAVGIILLLTGLLVGVVSGGLGVRKGQVLCQFHHYSLKLTLFQQ